jgi:hypothetical protein
MLNLQCRIEIRSKNTQKTVTFDYANSIEVKTSCENLTDTATVKVPRKMQWKGKSLLDYVNRNDECDHRKKITLINRKHPEAHYFTYYSLTIKGKTYWVNVKMHKDFHAEVLYAIKDSKPDDLIPELPNKK